MPIQVMNTESLVSEFTSWFFYGRTRTGKTTAAATFPAPIFLQPMNEDSIDTLQGMSVDYIPLRPTRLGKGGDTQIISVMDEALSHLENKLIDARKLWDRGDMDGGNAIFPWMTVVFESISHYTDMLQEELTRHAMIDMDQQKWGKLSAHMRSVHERMKSLPVHVVYVSLVSEKHDQKGKLISGEPVFPGQMSMKLPSACGGVVYFDRREGNPQDIYSAHFTRTDVFNAGVRYPKLRSLKTQRPFNFAEIAKLLGIHQ
jgi:hypothetical protein